MHKKFGKIISILYRKSQVYLGTALKKYDLTAAELPFFTWLQKQDGVNQEELSELLNIDKAATARSIKSLEGKGYIKRVTDGRDRRQNRVFLTEKAAECRDAVFKELYGWNVILTKGIDDDTLETTFSALEIMEKNVREELKP